MTSGLALASPFWKLFSEQLEDSTKGWGFGVSRSLLNSTSLIDGELLVTGVWAGWDRARPPTAPATAPQPKPRGGQGVGPQPRSFSPTPVSRLLAMTTPPRGLQPCVVRLRPMESRLTEPGAGRHRGGSSRSCRPLAQGEPWAWTRNQWRPGVGPPPPPRRGLAGTRRRVGAGPGRGGRSEAGTGRSEADRGGARSGGGPATRPAEPAPAGC